MIGKSVKIRLDTPVRSATWDPSKGLHGRAVINVTDNVYISDFWVVLYGETICNPLSTANLPKHPMFFPSTMWHIHMMNKQVMDVQQIIAKIHFGRFSKRKRSAEPVLVESDFWSPTEIIENFSFNTKQLALPESWRGNKGQNASVRYWLVARVAYTVVGGIMGCGCPTEKKVEDRLELTVRTSFSLSILDPRDPFLRSTPEDVQSQRKTVKTFSKWGIIHCRLFLPYKGFLRGEWIPAVVYIDNRCHRTIRSASLQFLQVITLRTRNESSLTMTLETELSRCRLERVDSFTHWHRLVLGMRVPSQCKTDGSFVNSDLVSIKFLVRLKVHYWFFNTVMCESPCHVGTRRPDSVIPNPLINLENLPIYPASYSQQVPWYEATPFSLLPPPVEFDEPPPADTDVAREANTG